MEENNPSVHLRAMEPEDIDAIYQWENDPSIWVYGTAHQPFSKAALQRFIDNDSGNDIYTSRQIRLMADTDGIGAIGCIDLYDFDPYNRRAAVGILTDSRLRNQGFGTAMLKAVELFAAEHLNIHQLYCDIASNNTISIHLFKRQGYTLCGTLKEWIWDNDKWIDALSFQKIIK